MTVEQIFESFEKKRPDFEIPLEALTKELEAFHHIVLYGAGSSGIALLRTLQKAGIHPACFADGDERKWGTVCEALPVFPSNEAAKRYGAQGLAIVCINTDGEKYCRSFSQALREGGHGAVHQKLKEAGFLHIIDYTDLRRCFALFRGDGEGNLPSCSDVARMLEEKKQIAQVFRALGDDLSRQTFLKLLEYRLFGSDVRVPTFQQDSQYFPEELFALTKREAFVDCGAFNGITLKNFLQRTGNQFERYYAIEPDDANWEALNAYAGILPPDVRKKLELVHCALWDRQAAIPFYALSGPGSFAAPYATIKTPARTLDQIVGTEKVSAIKMNIEGSELQALRGAADTIRKNRPLLMIAGYHKTWDLWEIPKLIMEYAGTYRLYLRSYMNHLSFVYYAVEAGRTIQR